MGVAERCHDQSLPVKTRSALPRSFEMMLSHDKEWLQMQECFAIHALQAEHILAERCHEENLPVKTRSALPGSFAMTTSLDEEDSDEEGFEDVPMRKTTSPDRVGECKDVDMSIDRTQSRVSIQSAHSRVSIQSGLSTQSATIYDCPFIGCAVCGSSVFLSQHERKCPCRMNGRNDYSEPKPTLKKSLSKQFSSTSLSPTLAAHAFFQAPLNAGRRR